MNGTDRSALSPTAVWLLLGAPLLMAVGRLLLVPFDDQGWDAVLTQAAAHQNRSDAGWILAMAASGLLGASAMALASVLRAAGRAKASAVVAVTTALGWAGAAGICAIGLSLSYQGKAPDRAVQVQLLKDVNVGHSAFVFLLCVFGAVGYGVLAAGLARSGVVGKGVALLLGVGGVGTLLTAPGPLKPLLVAASLVLLAAQVLVVRAVSAAAVTATQPVREPVAS